MISGNPAAVINMIGERVANFIKNDYKVINQFYGKNEEDYEQEWWEDVCFFSTKELDIELIFVSTVNRFYLQICYILFVKYLKDIHICIELFFLIPRQSSRLRLYWFWITIAVIKMGIYGWFYRIYFCRRNKNKLNYKRYERENTSQFKAFRKIVHIDYM